MIVKTWGSAVTQFFEKIIFQVSILNRRRAICYLYVIIDHLMNDYIFES